MKQRFTYHQNKKKVNKISKSTINPFKNIENEHALKFRCSLIETTSTPVVMVRDVGTCTQNVNFLGAVAADWAFMS